MVGLCSSPWGAASWLRRAPGQSSGHARRLVIDLPMRCRQAVDLGRNINANDAKCSAAY